MIEDYADLKAVIEAAGFFTTFQPIDQPGDRIVCASQRYTSGPRRGCLHGNSFWVAKRGAAWFVASWAPVIYHVPDHERVADLCLRLLRREPGRAYGDFDEQFRKEFALTPVSDEEFDRAAL